MNQRAGVPMSLVCKGRLAGVLLLGLICISCGDVYRPTIIPNPVPTPDPKSFHAVIAVNQKNTSNHINLCTQGISKRSIGASTHITLPAGFSPTFGQRTEATTMYVATATS